MKGILRRCLQVLLALLLVVFVAIAGMVVFSVPIDLTGFKVPVQAIASRAIGREVVIAESLLIPTSLSPVVTIQAPGSSTTPS